MLVIAGFGGVLAWTAWHVVGVLSVDCPDIPPGLVKWLHWIALGLGGTALLSAGVVTGRTGRAGGLASTVRVQAWFLVGLFVIVFVFPITSDQMTDVLRAWGDGPPSKVLAGTAGALLLGAVCRASGLRLLLREQDHEDCHAFLRTCALVIIGAVVAAALRLLKLEAAAAVALSATLTITHRHRIRAPTGDVLLTRRRLAGTLAVIPLAILLAGLARATTESLLLDTGLSDRWPLIIATLAVTAITAVATARAHRGSGLIAAARASENTPALVRDRLTHEWKVGYSTFVMGAALAIGFGAPLLMLAAPEAGAWLLLGLSVLAACLGVAWATAPIQTHQARTIATAHEPQSLAQAARTWLDARAAAEASAGREDRPLPMLIVAASGGGSKGLLDGPGPGLPARRRRDRRPRRRMRRPEAV